MMATKVCKKCNMEKPIQEFSRHADTRDKLDHRCKACVRLVKANSNRIPKPRELDIFETDISCRDWQGGKKKGSIMNRGGGLFVASVANKKSKSFRLNDFDMDESKLREEAHRFLYAKSLELGLTTNRYKIIFHNETDEPQYLLVQLSKNYVMLCDYDQLELIKMHHLFATTSGGNNEHKSHYAGLLEDGKNIPFHKAITGFEMTDHINRYPMDNRRCNLRETNALDNNRNRTNYYSVQQNIDHGIRFDAENEIWNALVTMDNKPQVKSFVIHNHGGYEESKRLAYEWCKQMIHKYDNNPMTGVSFYERDNAWRSYIKINGKMIMKTFPAPKFGYDTAKQMAIDWRKEMAQKTDNYVSRPDEIATNRHADYDRLRSEFEDIMIEHAGGLQWKF